MTDTERAGCVIMVGISAVSGAVFFLIGFWAGAIF